MKKNILEQHNQKYKEIIIPYAYEKLREIRNKADKLYQNKLISLQAKELIIETIAEKNNHSVIIGVWSLFSLLAEENSKKVRNLTHSLASNVFLFDLLDNLVDNWKISRKETLEDLYFNILIDPFRAKDKKRFLINRSQKDKLLKDIVIFISYLVKEASFDKYNLSKEPLLEDLCLNEINFCARSQFILALSKIDRRKEINRFVKEEYVKKNVKKMNLLTDHIGSFLLISGTPISALFFKTLQVINERKFIATKEEILKACDILLSIKIINIAGDQIKDKYYDRQMSEWSYAEEVNLDIFWLKKMIFEMWVKLKNKNKKVNSIFAFISTLLVRYYIGSLLYASIREEKCGDSIVELVTKYDSFNSKCQ